MLFDDLPRPLVLATGVFDLLHAQHVKMLSLAAGEGASLVVGINTDASVRRIKGPSRPIIPARDRAAVLRALRVVSYVYFFDEDTPEELIKRLRPDVLVKGHDYERGDKPMPEAKLVQSWGGRVWFADTSGRTSTSQIIEKIRSLP